MSEDNLYNVSDEQIETIEKQIAHAEIDSETAEQFLDACFPGVSAEQKVKIAIFAERFSELFLGEDE